MATKTKEIEIPKNIKEMFDSGAHFGFSKARRHPSFKPLIYGAKNNTEIINLEKTEEYLQKALEFVTKLASERKVILYVGGKSEVVQTVKGAAETIDMPYVAGRWIGGALTNFDQIKKRVALLADLTTKKEKGELLKYTKKERLLLDRKIDNLTKSFYGIRNMSRLPDALFVVDGKKEQIAVTEAQKMKIPVIGLLGTDCDLSKVEYPIPANDSGKASVNYFVSKITETYKNAPLAKKD